MLRAQGRGAEAIRPWNHPTIFLFQKIHDPVDQVVLAGGPMVFRADAVEELLDLRRLKARTEVTSFCRSTLTAVRADSRATGARQRAPLQCAAGIAGRRLNPDVVERPLAQQPAVRHAVQRNAAGQTSFFMPVS